MLNTVLGIYWSVNLTAFLKFVVSKPHLQFGNQGKYTNVIEDIFNLLKCKIIISTFPDFENTLCQIGSI